MAGAPRWAFAALFVLIAQAIVSNAAEPPAGRTPWATSSVRGEPEPPPPYMVQEAFPKLSLTRPLLLDVVPGTRKLLVAEAAGRIVTFPEDPAAEQVDLAIDLKAKYPSLVYLYGLAFHPKYQENHYVYICYVIGNDLPDGTKVSRFRATSTDPLVIDPASEEVILTFWAGGHNGGCLAFGNDGMLYISSGDGVAPSPPDPKLAGQDLSHLLSKILRIDVDHQEGGRPYRIPPDNPFVGLPGARGETWAYGFRNPWRMSFDRATGDLWLGDVGWEAWEMVHRVERGGNYGWSITEAGRQDVYPDAPRGPTPIQPPVVAHPHSEAASMTGGYVYRGPRMPELRGAYVYGDFQTGSLWSIRYDREARRVNEHKLIARSPLQLVSFGEGHEGELYLLDFERTMKVYRLAPNPSAVDGGTRATFPRTLSATGLFASVADLAPAPGVTPYRVNTPLFADGARAERFLGIPGTGAATPGAQPETLWTFPEGSVLARTVSVELEPGRWRRVETQVLHFEDKTWRPYTYAWNDEQTEATLVGPEGATLTLAAATDGKPAREYRIVGRGECMQCHNPWAGNGLEYGRQSASPLTANTLQLDVPARAGDALLAAQGQLARFESLGLIAPRDPSKADPAPPENPKRSGIARLVDPLDEQADLALRARSYLHANCAHCHRFGGGGSVTIRLGAEVHADDMVAFDLAPKQGTFGLPDAKIVAPGEPDRSVLYYRMAVLGAGHMPRLGAAQVDAPALSVIRDWIASTAPGRARPPAALAELTEPGADDAFDRAIATLLESPDRALALLNAVDRGAVEPDALGRIVEQAKDHPRPEVRDLFTRFVPESERPVVLGERIDPAAILGLSGDAERGRALFLSDGATQCKACHKLEGQGREVGPDLAAIGTKYDRAQLLTHLLQPSLAVDRAYVQHVVETTDGRILSGLIAERTDAEVVIRDAQGQVTRLPAAQVGEIAPLPTSLMPEGLLRGLTPQQAADLVEFLATRKAK